MGVFDSDFFKGEGDGVNEAFWAQVERDRDYKKKMAEVHRYSHIALNEVAGKVAKPCDVVSVEVDYAILDERVSDYLSKGYEFLGIQKSRKYATKTLITFKKPAKKITSIK